MKGIVFTEFLELVENEFGLNVLDSIIEKSDLNSGGVYTSVGTYPHGEMVQLVTNLSNEIDTPVDQLLFLYGKHFFTVLVSSYPAFFKSQDSLFSFLESIENYIHPEVLKLYPDAELPRFQTKRDGSKLIMRYFSSRKMADFAHGLMVSSVEHFNEDVSIDLQLVEDDKSVVDFILSTRE